MSAFYNVNIPKMKVNKVIYIPKTDPDFIKHHGLLPDNIKERFDVLNEETKRFTDLPNDTQEKTGIGYSTDDTMFHTDFKEYNSNTHVMVRILYNKDFPYDFKNKEINPTKLQASSENKQNPGLSFMNMCGGSSSAKTHGVDEIDTIIIHIHGGGFIAMSSNSHQIYTREWVKGTNYVLFSIDYRLAPEHPYPAALEDCWQVYYWVLNYSQKHLNINPSKIIMVGDSAGGNLASCVTIMSIKNGFKVPDGLILPYPAMTISKNAVIPSIFYSLTDPILNLNFLNLCFKSYLGNVRDPNDDAIVDMYDKLKARVTHNNTELTEREQEEIAFFERDYLVSPMRAPDDILEKFPPIRIMVGTNDPLRDMAYLFLQQ